jgi:hypothetical protein
LIEFGSLRAFQRYLKAFKKFDNAFVKGLQTRLKKRGQVLERAGSFSLIAVHGVGRPRRP